MMRLYLLFIYLFILENDGNFTYTYCKDFILRHSFQQANSNKKKNRVEQYLVDKGHHKQQKNEMHYGYFKSTVLWKGADENGCSHLLS